MSWAIDSSRGGSRYRIAVGAFHDQYVGPRRSGRLGSGGGPQFEVARVQHRSFTAGNGEHGGAKNMAGRMRRQNTIAPGKRLAEAHYMRRARSKTMLVKLGSGWRAIGQLVPRHVIGVGMRDEPPRLPPAHIHA